MTNRRRKGGRDSGRESGGADSGSCDGDSTNGGINRVHSISNRGSAKRRGSRAAFTYMIALVAAVCFFGLGYWAARTSPAEGGAGSGEKGPKVSEEGNDLVVESVSPSSAAVSNRAIANNGIVDRMSSKLEARLDGLLKGTFTAECQKLVMDTYETYLGAFIGEDFFPFERSNQAPTNECSPKAARSGERVAADDVRLVYLILMHEQAFQTQRLIDVLDEDMVVVEGGVAEKRHHFVVHVDGKPFSDGTYQEMLAFAAARGNVHMITDHEKRRNVSWGGFNVVQATLSALQFIVTDEAFQRAMPHFDWIASLSAYTYPLVSNREIRERLAGYPADTNFLEISPAGNKPAVRTWHHFVECDHAMRRIWRLAMPSVTMYAGSQWFTVTRAFAEYVAPAADANDWSRAVTPPPPHGGGREAFAVAYARYGRHTMVADENYFSTVMKNSRFCHTHENNNFLHVQFDRYEHEKASHKAGKVVQNKCLMPNPNHCGRSPTVVTMDFLPVLDLAETLFARKFDPSYDEGILDAVDRLRTSRASYNDQEYHPAPAVRFALRPRHRKDPLLCLMFTERAAAMVNCADASKASGDEVKRQQIHVGPCSRDGELKLDEDTGIIRATKGPFSQPYCLIREVGTGNRCLDVEREQVAKGARLIKWMCKKTKWNQLFSFDEDGHVFINVPFVENLGKRMCIQAAGWRHGAELRLMPCDGKEPLQTFFVLGDPDEPSQPEESPVAS